MKLKVIKGEKMKKSKLRYASFWCSDCGEMVKENCLRRHKCKKCGFVWDKEEIKIPVYYAIINRKKVIDEDSIRKEFEYNLKHILEQNEVEK